MDLGYRPLFILPFEHRTSFSNGLFGFSPLLAAEQTVAESKRVVYGGFKRALDKGAPREAAGILVGKQFGAAILSRRARRPNAGKRSSPSNTANVGRSTSRLLPRPSSTCSSVTTRNPVRQ